jgi:hypothetical protein
LKPAEAVFFKYYNLFGQILKRSYEERAPKIERAFTNLEQTSNLPFEIGFPKMAKN